MEEAYKKRSREVRRSARVFVLMSLLALHEFGHTELVGWIAVGVAVMAVFAGIMTLLEPYAGRAISRWHYEHGKRDAGLYEDNFWYRLTWDKARSDDIMERGE